MRIFIVKARTIIIAAAILIILPLLFFAPRAVETFTSSDGRSLPIYSVEREDNRIALTFDCAWNDDDIESILDTLKQNNCTAAFFVTGDWAQKYPESLKKIYDAGHIIGNHSYDHADYTGLSSDEIRRDIEKADECIREVCGENSIYMRAPSGSYNDNVIQTIESCGKICVQWSVDSLDYKDNATESSILSRLVETKKGDIILMHNGTELTSRLLPKIIKGLKKSCEFVSLDDLIYKSDFTVDHTGRQLSDTP
jgi:polysaccharide deacetylase family sporulation protein PdaB